MDDPYIESINHRNGIMSNTKIVNVTAIAQTAFETLNPDTCDIFEVEAACQIACSCAGYSNVDHVVGLVIEMVETFFE